MTERRKIRWVIAHYPEYLFFRTASAFKEELEKICPGEFDIEILTMKDYANKYDKCHIFKLDPPSIPGLDGTQAPYPAATWKQNAKKWDKLFDALSDGEFEISQTQATIIGAQLYKDFHAIDLPFLFKDHDHATRVLDGEIGESILKGMAEKTNIRGLAFTYSGGYRVIGSNQKITNLTELADSRLLTHTEHSNKLFKGVGADPVRKYSLDTEAYGDAAEDKNTSIETTYLRFKGKYVYKTDHSMFTTSILTGNKFWATLTEAQQNAFSIAAKATAKLERQWSIEDAAKYEADAKANGVEIIEISPEDRAELQKASQYAYEGVEQLDVDPVLVQAMITQGNNNVH